MEISAMLSLSGEYAEAYGFLNKYKAMHKPLPNPLWVIDRLQPITPDEWRAISPIMAAQNNASPERMEKLFEAFNSLRRDPAAMARLTSFSAQQAPHIFTNHNNFQTADLLKHLRRSASFLGGLSAQERENYKVLHKNLKGNIPHKSVNYLSEDWEKFFNHWRYLTYATFSSSVSIIHHTIARQSLGRKASEMLAEAHELFDDNIDPKLNDSRRTILSDLWFSKRDNLTPMAVLNTYLLCEEYNEEWAVEML